MARNLPGFYYDEDKKKYFKIQASHVLPQSASVHTNQSVEASREFQRSQKQLTIQQIKQRLGCIRRSPLRSSLSYALLARRLVRTASLAPITSKYFARNLSLRPAFCEKSDNQFGLDLNFRGASFDISRQGHICIARNSQIEPLVIAEPTSTYVQGDYAYDPELVVRPRSVFAYLDMPNGYTVAMSHDVEDLVHRFVVSAGQQELWNGESGPGYTTAVPLDLDTAIRDVAFSPCHNTAAVATDKGVYFHKKHSDSYELIGRSVSNKAQMNVTFLDDYVIASGERSGRFNLHDIRSKDSVVRLWHSSAVMGMQRTDASQQVIVHGFSSTSIYDLRYTKAPKIKQKRVKSSQNIIFSSPLIDFSVPRNRQSDHYSLGKKMAYSSDLNMVVAVSSMSAYLSVQNFVTLYNASTGKVLPGPLTNKRFTKPVTCIGLTRVRDGPESIFTLSGADLLEWTIHHDLEDKPRNFVIGDQPDFADVNQLLYQMHGWRTYDTIASKWLQGNKRTLGNGSI